MGGRLEWPFFSVIKPVDELWHLRVIRPPQMHRCEHCDDVGALETSAMGGEKIEEISGGDAGVEKVRVAEATDPSVFDNV